MGTATAPEHRALRIVRRRHPWRWLLTAVLVACIAAAITSLAGNERVHWDIVGDYLFSSRVLKGLWLTIWLTLLATISSFVIGTALAAMSFSANPVARWVSASYVWLFRSVPLMVQLLLWFNLAALYPEMSLGIPFGPSFVSIDSAAAISAITAAILGVTLHESAYAAEIVRGGILAVGRGQLAAAESLGLGPLRTLRRIILPQATPVIIPPAGNLLVGTLKGTALISVIGVSDLMYSVQLIYAQNYRVIPLLFVATIWYCVITAILTVAQHLVERGLERRTRRVAQPLPEGERATWARSLLRRADV